MQQVEDADEYGPAAGPAVGRRRPTEEAFTGAIVGEESNEDPGPSRFLDGVRAPQRFLPRRSSVIPTTETVPSRRRASHVDEDDEDVGSAAAQSAPDVAVTTGSPSFWRFRSSFRRPTLIPHTLHWFDDGTSTETTTSSLAVSVDGVLDDTWSKQAWSPARVERLLWQLASDAQARVHRRASRRDGNGNGGGGAVGAQTADEAADQLLLLLPQAYYSLASRATEQQRFVRLVVLYVYGGVYVDADGEVLAPLDALLDHVSGHDVLLVGRSYDRTDEPAATSAAGAHQLHRRAALDGRPATDDGNDDLAAGGGTAGRGSDGNSAYDDAVPTPLDEWHRTHHGRADAMADYVIESGWMACTAAHPVVRETLLRVLHALELDVTPALAGRAPVAVPVTWGRGGWFRSAPTVNEALADAVRRALEVRAASVGGGRIGNSPAAGADAVSGGDDLAQRRSFATVVVVARHQWQTYLQFRSSDSVWTRLPQIPGPFGAMQRAILGKNYVSARWWALIGVITLALVIWLIVWLWRRYQPLQMLRGFWGGFQAQTKKRVYDRTLDHVMQASHHWWWPW